jgi:TRAP-type mannitol/chloroaromatic compound transport system permease small subunit
MPFERILAMLRRLNRGIALAVGLVLALTVVFILLDIALRQLARSFGGSDEISGYVMAVASSWGLSYALLELGHVRIDLIRLRLQPAGRSVLDLLAILALTGTTIVIAFQAWPVLAKSIASGSLANTALATPLWIPQSIWFAGWVWFAVTACTMLVCAIGLLVQQRREAFDRSFGTASEVSMEAAQ